MTPSPSDLQSLQQVIFQLVPMPETEWQALANCWHLVEFKRKALVTAAGELERYAYFVLDGVQRAFYLEGDKEATLMFAYTGSFSGIVDAFLLQQPSRYYLETLTACKCLRLSYTDLGRLMHTYPLIAQWVHLGTVHAFSGVMERHMQWQTRQAEEKFRTLLTRSPHLLNLVPHKYLASYLGIDPATFSKLLGAVRI
jgi:CRP-like cAMP-binding protein